MKKSDSSDAGTDDLAVREKMLDNRATWLQTHEAAAARRDVALAEREELIRLREVAMEARREADQARAERERLLVQLRDANEKLVLATVAAHQLADDANAARAAAADSEERFRSLVITSSAFVWRANVDGRVHVDPEDWRSFTGVSAGAEEWGWLEAVHPLDQHRVREAWTAAVTTTRPYTCQHRIQRREGGYAWVMARAVPILKSRTVREWIGMMTDISDHMRIEEAREQFIGILGHDLRNPLASIVSGAEILSALPEPYAKTVTRITRSARRMEAIIRDLLDFARGRLGGGIPISPRLYDLRQICEEVIEEMRQAHPARVLTFETVGDLWGEWDPDRVEQVISNVIGNALTHGEDPIHVKAADGGDEVVTTVHNHGPPIAEAAMSTLFEPFTTGAQGAGGTGRINQGLGLGLYIAHEIVRAHEGTIAVSSVPGEGTTFTISLPRSMRHQARRRTEKVR